MRIVKSFTSSGSAFGSSAFGSSAFGSSRSLNKPPSEISDQNYIFFKQSPEKIHQDFFKLFDFLNQNYEIIHAWYVSEKNEVRIHIHDPDYLYEQDSENINLTIDQQQWLLFIEEHGREQQYNQSAPRVLLFFYSN